MPDQISLPNMKEVLEYVNMWSYFTMKKAGTILDLEAIYVEKLTVRTALVSS